MSIKGRPTAWIDSIRMLDNWKYGEIDLGPPAHWGPDTILVIDSLSRWCDAAYNFHEVMTPVGKSGQDGRAVYGNAQDDVEKQLACLTSATYTCNVIIICHGVYQDLDGGGKKIFPQGVGQKLSPKIPQYFPNYVQLTKRGEERHFRLKSTSLIDLAVPPDLPEELPPETGLATLFAAIRDQPQNPEAASPAPRPPRVTLLRK
jgi:hypothetical protein